LYADYDGINVLLSLLAAAARCCSPTVADYHCTGTCIAEEARQAMLCMLLSYQRLLIAEHCTLRECLAHFQCMGSIMPCQHLLVFGLSAVLQSATCFQ
jgi:hypothetical protein